MDKEALRESLKVARLAMDAKEVAIKSRLICQKILKDVDWQNVKNVSVFKSISGLNEVDLSTLLADVKKLYPGIEIDIIGQSKTAEIPKDKFDLILVPCLAFDKDNYRLGWGGGFYDKFLASQSQALKIGLCYQNGFTASGLPHEPHDIQLDRIITEA